MKTPNDLIGSDSISTNYLEHRKSDNTLHNIHYTTNGVKYKHNSIEYNKNYAILGVFDTWQECQKYKETLLETGLYDLEWHEALYKKIMERKLK